ncbi:hypothetical protein Y032_0105g3682 [Ancylostoma ceylanicum]|uniref:Uncharacterized protein n=1 Tax=Ancylostoma ceylanicum TaxID=53326 RepID=A0A016TGF4_9BILA|nr:hypothetical protein Y032_0105g3682 [Ancylostoma ceylanicum]
MKRGVATAPQLVDSNPLSAFRCQFVLFHAQSHIDESADGALFHKRAVRPSSVIGRETVEIVGFEARTVQKSTGTRSSPRFPADHHGCTPFPSHIDSRTTLS